MTFEIIRVSESDTGLFEHIADDVFDEPVDSARLRAYLAEPGHLMVAAMHIGESGRLMIGQCAGVIHRHPDKPNELYIDEVGTAAAFRRQGVAKAMLRELLSIGRELGCREAWLGTEPDNEAAQALYKNFHHEPTELFSYFEFPLNGDDD